MRAVAGAAITILVVVVLRWCAAPDVHEVKPISRASLRYAPEPTRVPPPYNDNPLRFLSTAPPDSLALLPGIGPVLAERIARARTGQSSFSRWDDLLAVRGIGPKTVDRLRALAHE